MFLSVTKYKQFNIRECSAYDVVQWMKSVDAVDNDPFAREKLLAIALIKDDGTPLFADAEVLSKSMGARLVAELWKQTSALNGITAGSVDAAKKDTDQTDSPG